MKDERNKHLKILAQKIIKAENELLLGINVKENEDKIENIMRSLSIDEMLKLDMYISKYDKNQKC